MLYNLVFLLLSQKRFCCTIKLAGYFLLLFPATIFGQQSKISGTVLDQNNAPISFVTVLANNVSEEKGASGAVFVKGTTTDDLGNFTLENVEHGNYTLHFSFIGFETQTKKISLITNTAVDTIILLESSEMLDQAVITIKRPTIQKAPGRLVFSVENTSVASGSALDVLKKTPGVLVSQQGISIKNNSPVIHVNNKRVYLSGEETLSLLQSTNASLIKSVEVITNPSSKYDADATTVLNISTTRAVAVGYKGSVSGAYQQAVYAKYNLATAHFYKNNWLNAYASYSYAPRKEFKEDENNTRFFDSNELTTSGYRDSYFTRETKSNAHQANVVLDLTANKQHAFGISATVFVSPNKRFDNRVLSLNTNRQLQLDSTFTTSSASNRNTSNIALNASHTFSLANNATQIVTQANYVTYNADREQGVVTNYFSPNGQQLRNNDFNTYGSQDNTIFTGQIDLSAPLTSGALEWGLKISDITTRSAQEFFDQTAQGAVLNPNLSDGFRYQENIFAAYFNIAREWEQWSLDLGLRAEQTQVKATSKIVGEVNNQYYFELFPKMSLLYSANQNNSFGLSYSRSISRPNYESLNPFRYFINENNYTDGNPSLVPEIDSKYTFSYTYNNTWFLEAYYWYIKNPLEELRFQNNTTRALQNLETNLIEGYQYSLDVTYAKSVRSWWYLQVVTSGFFIENEFFALQSAQETALANTYGFYGQIYSGLVLSEQANITSDITMLYISNLIFGSYTYKNQFNLSASLRKKVWDKKASITIGVDDIFNTNNVPVVSRYANQDNGYFARTESRLFRVGFTYNFGNSKLQDNNREITTKESDRLN
jgi:hypothetical protein